MIRVSTIGFVQPLDTGTATWVTEIVATNGETSQLSRQNLFDFIADVFEPSFVMDRHL